MKGKLFLLCFVLVAVVGWMTPTPAVHAAEPIVIGVPTSLGFLEGKESHKAVQIAVSEINAKGGINVGGTKRLLKVAATDLRDAAPGVPVPEALLGLEKINLEKKPAAIVVGPFRSEALIAGMDIIAKYKVPMLGTIAMSPGSEKKVKQDPQKYKYIFRTCLNAVHLVRARTGSGSQNLSGLIEFTDRDLEHVGRAIESFRQFGCGLRGRCFGGCRSSLRRTFRCCSGCGRR